MSTASASASPPAPRRGRPPSGGREAVLEAALALLRERGASRLTTREVARRAGVSEGSVFYHFTDRTGLMTAVIEDGLSELQTLHEGAVDGKSVHDALEAFTAAVEAFLDRALVVMIAAQSDSELRAGLADYLLGRDMGPHRGVRALAQYLSRQQAEGVVRGDIDPAAMAFFVFSACYLRVSQRLMIADTYGADLPGRSQLMSTLDILLTPPETGDGRART